jgi:hypothetical protein
LTDPTDKQKDAHDRFKKMKGFWNNGVNSSCTKEAWVKSQKDDDILTVSRGLKEWKATDLQGQKNLVKALQKWGTYENVDDLIELTEAAGYGADVVRIDACKALSGIPDQKGANAVAARLESRWGPEVTGVNEALRAYQNKELVENALVGCLKGEVINTDYISGKKKNVAYDHAAKSDAISILKDIGTEKSLDALADLKGDAWCSKAATEASRAINARIRAAKDKKGSE